MEAILRFIFVVITIVVTIYTSYGLIGVTESKPSSTPKSLLSPVPTKTPLKIIVTPKVINIKKKDKGEMKLEMVWRGPVNKKEVALTFDDGPSAKTTEKILNILKKNNIHATFFVIGKNAEHHPKLLKKIYDDGNEIGNHSYSHPNSSYLSPSKIRRELSKTDKIISKITGKKTHLFRPPSGNFGYNLSFIVASMKYIMVLWWVDTSDWREPGKEKVMRIIRNHLTNGAIILMHENHKTTIEALPDIINFIKKRGYKFVTVSELLGN